MTTSTNNPLTSVPSPAPTHEGRRHLQGEQLLIKLCGPDGRHRELDLRIPERLVQLCMPSLTDNIFTDLTTDASALCIEISNLDHVNEVEIPGLTRLVNHITYLLCNNREWNSLPAASTVEELVLLYRACQMLRFDEWATTLRQTLEAELVAKQVTAEAFQSLWYAFGTSYVLVNVTPNMAKYGFDKGGYIKWFLNTEVPPKQADMICERIECLEKELAHGHGEVRWREYGARRAAVWKKMISCNGT